MFDYVAACAVVPLLLGLWYSEGTLRRSPWPAVAAIGWFGYRLGRSAVANIHRPHEWDYACFWLYGHIAAAHQNVYDPANFARFASPFTPSDQFRAAVLNVGFPYPPPSMALFLPLGHIPSVPLGLTLWYSFHFAALGAAAWVLGRIFFRPDGWRGALLALAIVLALPAAANTVGDAQTNFLLLLLVALALQARGTAGGAVWQTLAIWVKPYAAILFLLDILGRAWRRGAVAAAVALASFGIGALLVGRQAFISYLQTNPSSREPAFPYFERVNESLLAVVLRSQPTLPVHVSALHEPIYLICALLLSALSIAVCLRAGSTSDAAFATMLLLGLIVYPGTLSSYGVMLVVPLLVVWKYRAVFPGRAPTVAAISAAVVFLQGNPHGLGFEANVLLWAACAYAAFRQPAAAAAASGAAFASAPASAPWPPLMRGTGRRGAETDAAQTQPF